MSFSRFVSIISFILCASVTSMLLADENPVAPDGMTYVAATKVANDLAMSELQSLFSGDKKELTDLVSKGVEKNQKVLLGVYLSQILSNNPNFKKDSFATGEYQVPLDRQKGVFIHAELVAIDKQNQVNEFTDLFENTYELNTPEIIRKLTKDEMATIWFYISWDLVEPIYVVEAGGKKLVFEFDPSGSSLEWIEDITEPCFSLAIGNGGLPCMCQIIVHEDNRYASAFKPMSQCNKTNQGQQLKK